MQATREELFQRLSSLGIETTTVEHTAVYTVEESQAVCGNIPGGHCKNLFLKDKKGQLWLVVTLEDAEVNLKTLPGVIGAARISFGKADLLMEVLGVEPGSVTPFALINDEESRVKVVLDERMMQHDQLNYHPLKNTATTTIGSGDLVEFIKSCGHEPQIIAVS